MRISLYVGSEYLEIFHGERVDDIVWLDGVCTWLGREVVMFVPASGGSVPVFLDMIRSVVITSY